jgi:hypothetical protein
VKAKTARKPKVPKRPKTPAPPAAAKPNPREPDWWEHTPGAYDEYELVMWSDSSSQQGIGLTRDEYIILKSHLAKMRGLKFTDPDYEIFLLGRDSEAA